MPAFYCSDQPTANGAATAYEYSISWTATVNTINWAFGWQDWLIMSPDAKEILNKIHLGLYRKTLFSKRQKHVYQFHARIKPVVRQMLQRTNIQGRPARK